MTGALMIGLAAQLLAGNHYDPQRGRHEAISVPRAGVEAVAARGAVIVERENFVSLAAVRAGGEARKNTSGGDRAIAAGSLLAIIEDQGRLTACQTDQEFEALCLTDRDRDGRFDIVNTSDGFLPSRLPAPIGYEAGHSVRVRGPAEAVRQSLTYRGVTNGKLRLGYRQLAADPKQPVIDAEAAVPLTGSFPQPVRVAGMTIEVLGIDPAGLRYVVR